MKRSVRLLLVLLLSAGLLPVAARAQDGDDGDDVAARYDAAISWANLVLVENDFEAAAAQANEAVVGQMTASVLENAWTQLEAQLGALQSLEPQDQGMTEGYHVVLLSGVFDRGDVDVQVVMANDHTIAGFFVRPAA